MLTTLSRAARLLGNYANPMELAFHRATGRPMVRVVDRATGIACRCARGSDRMFGETFHNREYDIPRLPIRPGDVVLDIGANHGFFSCYAAHQGARVFAFEPTRTTFAALEENIRANRLDDRVTARPWAVGAEDGTIELMCSDAQGGGRNTTIAEFAANDRLDVRERYTVPCRSLPSILDEFGVDRIRVCKLDCEGAELPILRSLGPDAVGRIDAFVAEYHTAAYDLADLVDVFRGWGNMHVSFSDRKAWNAIIRAVSDRALDEIAAAGSPRRAAAAEPLAS